MNHVNTFDDLLKSKSTDELLQMEKEAIENLNPFKDIPSENLSKDQKAIVNDRANTLNLIQMELNKRDDLPADRTTNNAADQGASAAAADMGEASSSGAANPEGDQSSSDQGAGPADQGAVVGNGPDAGEAAGQGSQGNE